MIGRLQYISQGDHLLHIKHVLEADCKWVQLRMKDASETDIKSIALKVAEMCQHYDAIFILNDHPQIAKEVNADGVHLGLGDMPVAKACTWPSGNMNAAVAPGKFSSVDFASS